jgi:PilZ domain
MPQRWLSALGLGKPRRHWLGKPHRQRPQRIARYFDCTWVTAWGEERARVSSLSLTGCYIESRFSVPPDGEAVRDLTIALPAGKINLQGTVLNATSGVGFAVRFIDLDAKTRERLSALIHIAQS